MTSTHFVTAAHANPMLKKAHFVTAAHATPTLMTSTYFVTAAHANPTPAQAAPVIHHHRTVRHHIATTERVPASPMVEGGPQRRGVDVRMEEQDELVRLCEHLCVCVLVCVGGG